MESIDEKSKNLEKPKIAIVIDKEGWAYHNSAIQIKKHLSKYYDIDIIPIDIFGDNAVKLFILNENYNLIFFMWRGIITWLYSDYSKNYIYSLGFEFNEFLDKFVKNRNIVTAVYDHLFINSETERTDFILNNVKAYTVSSEKLKEIYNNYPNNNKPSMVISDGVDLELFKMNNKEKYNDINNRVIKIGWTGNSKFLDEQDDDLKGLQKIIKPAIAELQAEGYTIELDAADRNTKMIPHDEMPEYYNNIDIYVCASRTEGTPNTVLEAMACGVPIISTDVGIVPEALGEKQKEYIIKREKEQLKEKIKQLINNSEILKQLSEENLIQIQDWSWDKKALEFKKFFDENIGL